MPYMTGFICDVEKALYLRRFDVPFYGLTHVFGHYPMYWYRLENHWGRNSLFGTTVHSDTALPLHLAADEKLSFIAGTKAFVATTVAENCILGASVASNSNSHYEHNLPGFSFWRASDSTFRHIRPAFQHEVESVEWAKR